MRLVWLGLLGAGCITQGSFSSSYVEAYCEVYDSCDLSGRQCPASVGDGAYKACDFDPALAKACLEGPFTCNADEMFFEFVEQPQACFDVCGGVE